MLDLNFKQGINQLAESLLIEDFGVDGQGRICRIGKKLKCSSQIAECGMGNVLRRCRSVA
jgi:hypothetical protein